jgi:hypothetical protein
VEELKHLPVGLILSELQMGTIDFRKNVREIQAASTSKRFFSTIVRFAANRVIRDSVFAEICMYEKNVLTRWNKVVRRGGSLKTNITTQSLGEKYDTGKNS